MSDLSTITTILRYGAWANEELLHAASGLPDSKLDQPFDMGMGSLRKTLLHIHAGEHVWLQRWQGRTETPWPDENEPVGFPTLIARFRETAAARNAFLAKAAHDDFSRPIVYRDSRGSLFRATLGDMMLQMCLHSAHHRSQAVNMLRRLGASPPELDYMMSVRAPV